jgi:hypothetical protein
MGNITLILPKADARNIPLSCTLNMSGLSRQNLMARHPKNGFIS